MSSKLLHTLSRTLTVGVESQIGIKEQSEKINQEVTQEVVKELVDKIWQTYDSNLSGKLSMGETRLFLNDVLQNRYREKAWEKMQERGEDVSQEYIKYDDIDEQAFRDIDE